jgi:quercetin dioxygenase-like cupin family protein
MNAEMKRPGSERQGPQNLHELCGRLQEFFSPRVVGEVNDVYVKVTKTKGQDVPWHAHDNEDEMFLIVKGSLVMDIEGRDSFPLREGEFFIVPKGVRHRVSSADECWMMLMEAKSTKHTGDVTAAITKSIEDQL